MRQKNHVTGQAAVVSSRRAAVWATLFAAVSVLGTSASAGDLEDLARPQEGRSMRATSTARDENGDYAPSNNDNSRVAPGATKVVLEAEGPGVITHMWFTFLGPEPHPWAPEGSASHQEILLRIFYDGSPRPGVETPFGDFFANAFGKRSEVISVPVVVEDADSYNCFWRMPFRKSVRVELVNQSQKKLNLLYYNIDWIRKDSLPDDTPYFYAQYRQEYPVEQGEDYVILDTQGKGHYVGTVLSVRTRSPYTGDAHHGPGQAVVQTNLGFYPAGQLFYRPDQPENAWGEIPFTVEEKEPRRLLIKGTRASDYGRYQAYLSGVKIGPVIDLYDEGLSDWEWQLLDFWPDPGPYTLRLECVGKNPKSTGHYLGAESIRLRQRRPRVKEWARDKDKDWRKEPVLYE